MKTKLCPLCAEEIKDAAIKCKHCGEYLGSRPENDMQSDSVRPDITIVADSIESENKRELDINEAGSADLNTSRSNKKGIAKNGLRRIGIATTGGTGVFFLALLVLVFLYTVGNMNELSNEMHREINSTNQSAMYYFLADTFFADEIRNYQDAHVFMVRSLLYFTFITIISGISVAYIVLFPNKNLKKKKIAGWVLMGVAVVNFMVFPSGTPTWVGMFIIILPLITASAWTLAVVQELEKQKSVPVPLQKNI